MPGLIDCHVHVVACLADLGAVRRLPASYVAVQAVDRMRSSLVRGFTRLRDVGGADWGLARAARESRTPLPHLHYGGPALSQTGGHGDMRLPGEPQDSGTLHGGISRIVDGPDELRRAAREELRLGASHIKLMLSGGVASPTDPLERAQYSIEEISAVVAEAAATGRYVAGHCYTGEAVSRAVRNGVRSVEHGNLADDAALADIAAQGAWLVPTLSTYALLGREGRQHGVPDASLDKIGNLLEAGLDSVARAHALGVPMALGSDLLGPMHADQSEEFALRARVQPWPDVVRSATIGGASLLGLEGQVGEVRDGMVADLIALDQDPLSSPSVLSHAQRHLTLVMVEGRTWLP